MDTVRPFIDADTGKSHKIKSVFLPGFSFVIRVCNGPTAATANRRDVKLVSIPRDALNDEGCIDGGDQAPFSERTAEYLVIYCGIYCVPRISCGAGSGVSIERHLHTKHANRNGANCVISRYCLYFNDYVDC